MDYERASRGMPIRYQSCKKRKKFFQNDGRAPDTSKELVITSKANGRPPGSRNKVPKLGNDVDCHRLEYRGLLNIKGSKLPIRALWTLLSWRFIFFNVSMKRIFLLIVLQVMSVQSFKCLWIR
uniref:Uncharacterized protein n=1 Tax=Spongospora subterranea TaxID=70186 RepID=A0A0H5R259_9EUKA|eukprot:CRZ08275.1 hypothetical protein [Spongospora subterranea]